MVPYQICSVGSFLGQSGIADQAGALGGQQTTTVETDVSLLQKLHVNHILINGCIFPQICLTLKSHTDLCYQKTQ